MNTPGTSKSFESDPGRPPRTPLASERYNMSEPPLSTRLERMQSTPRLQIKSAPKLFKSTDRKSYGGKSIMTSPLPQIVSSSNTPGRLSSVYNPEAGVPYVEQIFISKHEIGQGSFGRVFSMECRESGRVYAVKCAQEAYRNKRNRKEKLHEVFMHERVPKHENLVEFICAWEENDLLYIVTELCEMSLEKHLHEYTPLPEWRIWDVTLDLTKAVHYLDGLNLLHVDVKPANVLVSFDGVCKLGDFGLMIDLNEKQKADEAYEGDSKYLAREVLTDSRITKEAVIFSLGISILQVATDLYLDSSGTNWHLIRDLKIDPKFTEHLTPELVNFIYRMMATRPEDRPSIATILNSQLLREHEANYRAWNRKMYFVFRKLTGKSPLSSILDCVKDEANQTI